MKPPCVSIRTMPMPKLLLNRRGRRGEGKSGTDVYSSGN
jgi:hypothetical protein